MRGLRWAIGVGAIASIGAGVFLDACATAAVNEGDDASIDSTTNDTSIPSDGGDAGCGNTATDPKNCGACGHACDAGAVCSKSQCATSCGSGTTQCGSSCVDEKTDPQHCGGCDASCASGDFCDAGACIPNCTSAQDLCDDGGLFCANVQTDNNNCGGCNIECTNSWTCQSARCLPNCGMQTLCDIDGGLDGSPPFCTNTNTDNYNCGKCDNACTGGQYCDAGTCATSPITTCKFVNGLTWCYHAGVCGEACNTVCSVYGKTPVSNQAAWTDAQATTSQCQALATAFNNVSTPSVNSYAYACVEVAGSGDDSGTVTGQIYCSTDYGCPSEHLTIMDGLGTACGSGAFVSICPCQ